MPPPISLWAIPWNFLYCFVLVIVSVIVVIIIAPFIRQEVQLYTVP
nr:MAG TPA: hypothetical protein [Caudoviricetes sp.]